MSLLLIFSIIIIILLVAFLALLIYLLTRKSEDDFTSPFHINLSTKETKGRAIILQKDVILCRNGNKIITGKPIDINPNLKKYKKGEKIEDIKFLEEGFKVLSFNEGSLSNDRAINIIFPQSSDDFPEEIKSGPHGPLLMAICEWMNFKKEQVNIYKEDQKRKVSHLEEIGMGEISTQLVDMMKKLFNEDIKRTIKDIPKENKFGNYQNIKSENSYP